MSKAAAPAVPKPYSSFRAGPLTRPLDADASDDDSFSGDDVADLEAELAAVSTNSTSNNNNNNDGISPEVSDDDDDLENDAIAAARRRHLIAAAAAAAEERLKPVITHPAAEAAAARAAIVGTTTGSAGTPAANRARPMGARAMNTASVVLGRKDDTPGTSPQSGGSSPSLTLPSSLSSTISSLGTSPATTTTSSTTSLTASSPSGTSSEGSNLKVVDSLVEYTRQQNELKYGKLIPIVAGVQGIDIKAAAIAAPRDPEEEPMKVVPEFVAATAKNNRAKYTSMMPIRSDTYDIEMITDVVITGYDKRFETGSGVKFYVYNIDVRRQDKVTTIFRRYSEFHALFTTLTAAFPGMPHPDFPPKIIFGRSHVKGVSRKRMRRLNEYLRAILQLKPTFIASEVFRDFFRASWQDLENAVFNDRLKSSGISFD